MGTVLWGLSGEVKNISIQRDASHKIGRQIKIDRIVTGGGCLVMISFGIIIPARMAIIMAAII